VTSTIYPWVALAVFVVIGSGIFSFRNQRLARRSVTIVSARLETDHLQSMFLDAAGRKSPKHFDVEQSALLVQPSHQEWALGLHCIADELTGSVVVTEATVFTQDAKRAPLFNENSKYGIERALAVVFRMKPIERAGEIASLKRKFEKAARKQDPEVEITREREYLEWS
jgi:hypothetical protein